MKNLASIFIASSWLAIGAGLFAFQNCAQPDPGNSTDSAITTPTAAQDPGSASNPNDLTNTGLTTEAPSPTPQPTTGGGGGSAQFVAGLYSGLLQRQPTSAETVEWQQYVQLGYGCSYIAQQVLGSPACVAVFPTLSTLGYIDRLYVGLLGRAPTSTEQASALAQSGQYSTPAEAAAALAESILASSQFSTYCSQFGMSP